MSSEYLAFVGCFTTERRRASGRGITAWRVSDDAREWSIAGQSEALINPSFLVTCRSGKLMYAAHGDLSYLSLFEISKGALRQVDQYDAGGINGVKLCLDCNERHLFVANYASGNVIAYELDRTGRIRRETSRIELTGEKRPLARLERQDGAHPHDVVLHPSGRFLVVPDLGLDQVFSLAFDEATGTLCHATEETARARTGSGPRHAVFSPSGRFLWIVNELDSTVSAYVFGPGGALTQQDVVSTLPGDYSGHSTAAEILFSCRSRRVYVSNRGHDSIVIFDVDRSTGRLLTREWVACRGRGPRFMCWGPEGDSLFVANEGSGDLQKFSMTDDGSLVYQGLVAKTPSPTSIVFVHSGADVGHEARSFRPDPPSH